MDLQTASNLTTWALPVFAVLIALGRSEAADQNSNRSA